MAQKDKTFRKCIYAWVPAKLSVFEVVQVRLGEEDGEEKGDERSYRGFLWGG
jgi:hypothetical protein